MRAFGMDQLGCYSIGISYETGDVNAHGDDARGFQTCSILHCILRKRRPEALNYGSPAFYMLT